MVEARPRFVGGDVTSAPKSLQNTVPSSLGLLGMDVAARYLHISERLMRKLWQTGQISGVKVGRKVRFRMEDISAFIERNQRPPR